MDKLEKLSYEEIANLICSKYGLTVYQIKDINGGRSDLYKMETNLGAKVLKCYQREVSLISIYNEICVCNYLLKKKFLVSRYIHTLDGTYIVNHKGRYYTLQFFEYGNVYQNYSSPDWLFMESALLLGRLHKSLFSFSVDKKRFGGDWPNDNDFDKAIIQHKAIISLAEQNKTTFSTDIIYDMKYKIALLNKMRKNIQINKTQLSYRSTHGDYCLQQMIVKDNRDIVLIDFSSFDCLPVIWEIIRSFSFIDIDCQYCCINLNSLDRYIRLYESTSDIQLSDYDRQSIFKFYAVQLLLSTGGYYEYFTTSKSDDKYRISILQFGFWRTKMMFYLFDNMNTLSIV